MTALNNAVSGGDAVINMVTTPEVAPDECTPATYVTVDVTLFVPSGLDLDENGIPDACAATCETLPGDLEGSGGVNGANISGFVDCLLQGPGVIPGCECADMNSPSPDGVLDQDDLAAFVLALLAE